MDKKTKKLINEAKRQFGKAHLLPRIDTGVIDESKGKLYSAKEALAERKKREQSQNSEPIIVNNTFIKPNEKPTETQVYAEQLKKYYGKIDEEHEEMDLQAMRFIIGPSLDFPLDKVKHLFKWVEVLRHPKTDQLHKLQQFRVLKFFGDVGEELLKDRRKMVNLVWEFNLEPEPKFNDKGELVGMKSNREYLFDPDKEYWDYEEINKWGRIIK